MTAYSSGAVSAENGVVKIGPVEFDRASFVTFLIDPERPWLTRPIHFALDPSGAPKLIGRLDEHIALIELNGLTSSLELKTGAIDSLLPQAQSSFLVELSGGGAYVAGRCNTGAPYQLYAFRAGGSASPKRLVVDAELGQLIDVRKQGFWFASLKPGWVFCVDRQGAIRERARVNIDPRLSGLEYALSPCARYLAVNDRSESFDHSRSTISVHCIESSRVVYRSTRFHGGPQASELPQPFRQREGASLEWDAPCRLRFFPTVGAQEEFLDLSAQCQSHATPREDADAREFGSGVTYVPMNGQIELPPADLGANFEWRNGSLVFRQSRKTAVADVGGGGRQVVVSPSSRWAALHCHPSGGLTPRGCLVIADAASQQTLTIPDVTCENLTWVPTPERVDGLGSDD